MSVLCLSHSFQGAGQLIVRGGVGRLQRNRALQFGCRGFRLAGEKQRLAQIIGRVGISGIEFGGFFQMGDRFLYSSSFEQAMSELVENQGIVRRTVELFFVFGDALLVTSQAGIGESQMIVPERRIGIDAQGGLKLFYRLQSAVGVLIGPA